MVYIALDVIDETDGAELKRRFMDFLARRVDSQLGTGIYIALRTIGHFPDELKRIAAGYPKSVILIETKPEHVDEVGKMLAELYKDNKTKI